MEYRTLGRTGLRVSRIGFGGEHVTNADFAATEAVMRTALDAGVNIMDVFMPQPEVRSHMGDALRGHRGEVILQGHIGSVLHKGQYLRSRDVKLCDEYVRDFLTRFHTDYIDLGMLHFIDTQEDFDAAFGSEYIDYCLEFVGLIDKRFKYPTRLSHGEKQWLEIGMLMAARPELMLLDEPVAGMGRKETEKTADLLEKIKKECSIIVVEHDMQFAKEVSDSVTVFHEGHVLDEGTMDSVSKNQTVIDVYLGRGGES